MLRGRGTMKKLALIFSLAFSLGIWAESDVEALSACELEADGYFTMMCICAKSAGKTVTHQNLSNQMPKPQKFANDKECEEAAEKPCVELCKAAKW